MTKQDLMVNSHIVKNVKVIKPKKVIINIKIQKKLKITRLKFPWKRTLESIKQRCNNKNCERFPYYGGRGIKCQITEVELRFLWFRDNASAMNYPTIDRENKNKHYIYENCQYIEHFENTGKDKRKPILQYDLDGKFIREWNSITEASHQLCIFHSNISMCLRKMYKTSGGFKWEYKCQI